MPVVRNKIKRKNQLKIFNVDCDFRIFERTFNIIFYGIAQIMSLPDMHISRKVKVKVNIFKVSGFPCSETMIANI